MSISRRQLRRDVLRDLGDLTVLTATATGSDVTFFDSTNLAGEVNAYKGRDVLFTGGTAANLGEIRHVNGSSASGRSIGWGTALPADTAVGDEAEMINTRGIGYRFQDAHDTINRVIRSVANRALVPATSDESTYARGVAVELPAEFATVENVQWLDSCDATRWHSIPKAVRANGYGWWVDKSARAVYVTGTPACTIDGHTIKVWGLAEPAELNDDDDETGLDPKWLVMATQAALARAKYLRMPTQETERFAFLLAQQADQFERRIATSVSPFSEPL